MRACGKLSGNKFSQENKYTSMFDMYFKNGITGEKIIVFNTDIRRKYMHELENGEKFVTEARMYHKMDLKYNVKCFNVVLVEGKYLQSGYTSNIIETFKKAPMGYYKYFEEIMQRRMSGVKFKKRIYAIKHYILFSYLAKSRTGLASIQDIYNKILYIMLVIPGKIKAHSIK